MAGKTVSWLLFLLFLSACCSNCCPKVSFENVSFCVDIADNDEARRTGLMNVDFLPDDKGMFFVFEDERLLSFWMKNTLIPLDIIFFDRNMDVVDVKHSFAPCSSDPCEAYMSRSPAMYVLEVNAGLAEKYNLKEGVLASLVE